MAVGIDDIVLAAVITLVGLAAEEGVRRKEQKKVAKETQVRAMYQAVKDRFNISYDQLNQRASQLDFDLQQLADSTRGSARLAVASKRYREYLQQYPHMVKKINEAKNTIMNEVNNLSSKEAEMATRISKGDISMDRSDVLGDVAPNIQTINTTLSEINQGPVDTNSIDTELKQVEQKTAA